VEHRAVELVVEPVGSINGPGRRPCSRPYRALSNTEGTRGRPGALGQAYVGLECQREANDPDVQSEEQFSAISHDMTPRFVANLSAQNNWQAKLAVLQHTLPSAAVTQPREQAVLCSRAWSTENPMVHGQYGTAWRSRSLFRTIAQ